MSYLLLIPSTVLLILGIRFFISRIWFESFSKSFISLFSMSVLSFTFNIWNIVIIIILKSLSTNSNIYIFLVLSIDWYFSFEGSLFGGGCCLVTFYWMPGLVNFTLAVLDIFIFLSLFLCLGTQFSYLEAFDPLKAFLFSRQSQSLILWLIFPYSWGNPLLGALPGVSYITRFFQTGWWKSELFLALLQLLEGFCFFSRFFFWPPVVCRRWSGLG